MMMARIALPGAMTVATAKVATTMDQQRTTLVTPRMKQTSQAPKATTKVFFKSLLSYLKTPEATIKHNNQHIAIISDARMAYQQQGTVQTRLQKEFFEVIGHGLESTIITTLGATMA
ncbi:hypothetical protein BGZ73_001996, partial [Actinomortierella ambigua]